LPKRERGGGLGAGEKEGGYGEGRINEEFVEQKRKKIVSWVGD
jgi:hypothetical protein